MYAPACRFARLIKRNADTRTVRNAAINKHRCKTDQQRSNYYRQVLIGRSQCGNRKKNLQKIPRPNFSRPFHCNCHLRSSGYESPVSRTSKPPSATAKPRSYPHNTPSSNGPAYSARNTAWFLFKVKSLDDKLKHTHRNTLTKNRQSLEVKISTG